MVNKLSLKELRKKVARARTREKNRLEAKKLKGELFELDNPLLAKTIKKASQLGGRIIEKNKRLAKKRKSSDDFGFNNPLTGGGFDF